MSTTRLRLILLDSIAEANCETRGAFVVTGSHGGISAARYALAHPPEILVFNDAGVGLCAAGIVGLERLASAGIAAFAVAHTSARIGDAASTLETGEISYLNAAASMKGIRAGERCRDVVARLCGTLPS